MLLTSAIIKQLEGSNPIPIRLIPNVYSQHSTTPAPIRAPTKIPHPVPTLPAPPVNGRLLFPPVDTPVPVGLGPVVLDTPGVPTAEYTPVAEG